MNDDPIIPPSGDGNYRVPWTVKDCWSGFLIFIGLSIVFYLVAGWVYLLFDIVFPWEIWLLISEILFIIPVWWLVFRKYHAGLVDLGFRPFNKVNIGIGCGLVFVLNLVTVLYSLLVDHLFDSPIQPDLTPIADDMAFPLMLYIVAILVAPLVEEVFFRGFLFAGLLPRYGWLKAAIISSFIFSVIHMQVYAILPLFLLGFVFAFLFYRSHSVWPGIILHFIVNLLSIVGEVVTEDSCILPITPPG